MMKKNKTKVTILISVAAIVVAALAIFGVPLFRYSWD